MESRLHLKTPPVPRFDRLDALAEAETLETLVGPLTRVERRQRASVASGYSNSTHESFAVLLRDGSRKLLRIKRTRVGEDWISRRSREKPPGREASLLAEPSLSAVWECFARSHLALAVEGSEVALLMEDYSEFLLPDVREPVGVEIEERLLRALASLHARFWEAPELDLPWLGRPEWFCEILGPRQALDPDALEGAPLEIREGVSAGWRSARERLPPRVGERLGTPAEELWAHWSDLPKTLLHGDVKVANFAFLRDGRVAAFDWGNLAAAPATVDLGWYLAVNSTRLARGKEALIARYRELLETEMGRRLDDSLWERMLSAGIVSGALMLLWSKALSLQRENSAFRRDDWAWWADRLTRWADRS